MSFGHSLLEDHGDMAIGNPVVIINEVNLEVMDKARELLEKVGYTGFANFDIKYDMRDGSYRFFEINTRLGRSNFYVTGSGFNTVKWIVDDLIYNKKFDGTVIADNENLYTVVPKCIIMKYITDPHLRLKIEELYRQKKVSNPLVYKGEKNLIHKLYVMYFMYKQKKRFMGFWKREHQQ